MDRAGYAIFSRVRLHFAGVRHYRPFIHARLTLFLLANRILLFHWFGAFEQDARDNKEYMKRKLKMPLLAMGGEYFGAAFLAGHCKLVAENVTASNIKGAGHWIVQENTEQVQQDLLQFFTAQ